MQILKKGNRMKLKEFFNNIEAKYGDININTLFVDSRKESTNGLFFCIKGLTHDSHKYIPQAIKNGAVAIVYDHDVSAYINKHKDIAFIQVDDTRASLSKIAEIFNDNPSSKLQMFGVTGTNGKTSVSYLIYKILSRFEKSAYNGTAGTLIGDEESPYTHLTTPDTLDLVRIIKRAADNDVKSFAIEVSSHSLDMKRASSIDFDVVIYTNLSRDHLDYHGTMIAYRDAKAELFRCLKNNGIAIINRDDKKSEYFINACAGKKVLTYGKSKNTDYTFGNITLNSNGTIFDLNFDGKTYEVKTNLISEINVYNLTAAIAAIHQSGKNLADIIKCVENIDFNIGRFQYVASSKYSILVDYAHTPDGFEKVFAFTDSFRERGRRVISVFGSAGKRDKGKRPVMGKIASLHSDIVVLTGEDSRDEDPVKIAEDIANGFIDNTEYYIEADREMAIKLAIEKAEKDDLILLLGKGKEDFLDIGNESVAWLGDDQIAKKYAEI